MCFCWSHCLHQRHPPLFYVVSHHRCLPNATRANGTTAMDSETRISFTRRWMWKSARMAMRIGAVSFHYLADGHDHLSFFTSETTGGPALGCGVCQCKQECGVLPVNHLTVEERLVAILGCHWRMGHSTVRSTNANDSEAAGRPPRWVAQPSPRSPARSITETVAKGEREPSREAGGRPADRHAPSAAEHPCPSSDLLPRPSRPLGTAAQPNGDCARPCNCLERAPVRRAKCCSGL